MRYYFKAYLCKIAIFENENVFEFLAGLNIFFFEQCVKQDQKL